MMTAIISMMIQMISMLKKMIELDSTKAKIIFMRYETDFHDDKLQKLFLMTTMMFMRYKNDLMIWQKIFP